MRKLNVLEVAMQGSVTKECKGLAVYGHYLTFKEGRQNVTDMPRPGYPAVREEDVQTVNTLLLVDRNATIHELMQDWHL